jgi:uncharacterized protein YjbI with pentapeptide repeats
MFGRGRKLSRGIKREDFLARLEAEQREDYESKAGARTRWDSLSSEFTGRDLSDGEVRVKDGEASGEAGDEKSPRWDPDHLEILKQGVKAWNQWRKENPEVTPNLQGVDFTDESFRETPLWDKFGKWVNFSGANFSGAKCQDANFSGANCGGANFSGAFCGRANFSGAKCQDANFSGAHCLSANFSGADCWYANFSGANCLSANFSGADCWHANFSGAHCWYANFSGANCERASFIGTILALCNLRDCNVTNVRYEKRLLKNRCHGIRAAECYGDAKFRRYVTDQDYLDQLASELRPPRGITVGDRLKRLLGGFSKPVSWIAGLLTGLVLSLMMMPNGLAGFAAVLGQAPIQGAGALLPYMAVMAGAIMLAGLLTGKAGQRFIFRLWSLFDYGRDLDRVIIFAVLMIFLFGGLYEWLGDAHIHYYRAQEAVFAGKDIWFYAWFVAMMGFATLGVTDLVEPVSGIGALVMMGNVLAGFVTLGLLLSVLGEKFARRS